MGLACKPNPGNQKLNGPDILRQLALAEAAKKSKKNKAKFLQRAKQMPARAVSAVSNPISSEQRLTSKKRAQVIKARLAHLRNSKHGKAKTTLRASFGESEVDTRNRKRTIESERSVAGFGTSLTPENSDDVSKDILQELSSKYKETAVSGLVDNMLVPAFEVLLSTNFVEPEFINGAELQIKAAFREASNLGGESAQQQVMDAMNSVIDTLESKLDGKSHAVVSSKINAMFEKTSNIPG